VSVALSVGLVDGWLGGLLVALVSRVNERIACQNWHDHALSTDAAWPTGKRFVG